MDNTVVYYHGCFVNYLEHETGTAVVDVLEKNGFKVEVPELICCSFPLLRSGDLAKARKRAARLTDTLAVFAARGFDIVYSCPTCGYALKEVFPVLLETESARLVAEKTSLISTYLLDLHKRGELSVEFKRMSLRVAYHTPCHLRSQQLSTASADMLSLIPGVELRHVERGCCGMGGTWALESRQRSELSEKVGTQLFEEIIKVNPQLISTDCAGCQIQIARYTDQSGNRMIHPIRVLAGAYSGSCPRMAI